MNDYRHTLNPRSHTIRCDNLSRSPVATCTAPVSKEIPQSTFDNPNPPVLAFGAPHSATL